MIFLVVLTGRLFVIKCWILTATGVAGKNLLVFDIFQMP